ncbi:MAG: hypothetical protein ACRDXC_10130 [Acidimicrobiales bacterium]
MTEPVAAGDDAPDGERGALSLGEAAVRHGAFRWVEQRLFELTGAWAAAPGLPDGARVFCFEQSAAHAWHAELWEARLPVLAGVDRDQLTRPVGVVVDPMLAGLAPHRPGGDEAVAGSRFLVSLARVVLPLLLVSYRRFGARLVPVADGPAIRALRHVISDEEEELCAAEALLDGLVGDPQSAQQAAEWTQAVRGPVGHGTDGEDLLPWSEADPAC